jgi:hypothetical protein
LGRSNLTRNTPGDQEQPSRLQTDILFRISFQLRVIPAVVPRLFGATDFPCGQGEYGFTICGEGPFSPGRAVVVSSAFDAEIPLEDPENIYQYGFVFDRDRTPENNYQASPAFPGDFFDGTDLWYELVYEPGRGWSLIVTDVTAGFAQLTSGARAIIQGNSITLVIPEVELSEESPLFRVTAFRHTGDFGFNPPYDWDGDVDPPVGEPLLELTDLGVEVQE